eukprot:scaffold239803_cov31-Tisochrysis_lutea.AAC.2
MVIMRYQKSGSRNPLAYARRVRIAICENNGLAFALIMESVFESRPRELEVCGNTGGGMPGRTRAASWSQVVASSRARADTSQPWTSRSTSESASSSADGAPSWAAAPSALLPSGEAAAGGGSVSLAYVRSTTKSAGLVPSGRWMPNVERYGPMVAVGPK